MMSSPWHVSVLIPARDEERLLPRCLESVLKAREAILLWATCDVVVVVDSSTDATMQIAKKMLGRIGSVLACDAGIVGTARAVAANHVLQRRSCDAARTWLANTDADCCVPAHWLAEQLTLAEAGAHVVAGIVQVDSFEEHQEWVPSRFRETYRIDADGDHPHVHGANLGVRADAYLRAGGWASLKTAEDHDLWGRLAAVGAVRVSSSRVHVVTSGRRVGRAPFGFAAALAAHNEVLA